MSKEKYVPDSGLDMGGLNHGDNSMKSWIKLLRPTHWIKNLFVFVPIFFSGKLGIPEETYLTLSAFAAFCLLCSAIYIFNDIKDREEDLIHPEKRFRPIASGQIAPLSAGIVSIFPAALSFLIAFRVWKEITWIFRFRTVSHF
ncbi:MAG: UbiA family prenyltransferase [Thermodesulfobacteriota bacterium]|nr:UbiA family prenyltransferase [Thermodesulfobacteriota bacterium]